MLLKNIIYIYIISFLFVGFTSATVFAEYKNDLATKISSLEDVEHVKKRSNGTYDVFCKNGSVLREITIDQVFTDVTICQKPHPNIKAFNVYGKGCNKKTSTTTIGLGNFTVFNEKFISKNGGDSPKGERTKYCGILYQPDPISGYQFKLEKVYIPIKTDISSRATGKIILTFRFNDETIKDEVELLPGKGELVFPIDGDVEELWSNCSNLNTPLNAKAIASISGSPVDKEKSTLIIGKMDFKVKWRKCET